MDINKKININKLASDLKDFFYNKTDLRPEIKVQKFRIYLKFKLLKELNLSQIGDSDLLYIKLEIFKEFNFCGDYKIEVVPLFKFNKSLLVKTFDLPTLMATKIRAVLYRHWEQTDKQGKILLSVKGRDYFDLMWYLDKNIKPNLACLEEKNKKDLIKNLKKKVEKVDEKNISLDLKNLINDQKYVENLSLDIKQILLTKIDKMFD